MIISHKHKFIFFKPWKVAGNSVEYNLIKHCGDNDLIDSTHRNPKDTLDIIGKKKFNKYFKFTIVRNPWDRMVSTYMWFMDDTNPGVSNFFDRKVSCFDEFVEMFFRYSGSGDVTHRYSQVSYLLSKYGIDFIGRFENLQKDFDVVCDKIGIPHQELLHIGKTEHKPYWEYYTDDSREFILDRYKDDIETFGYEFGK